MNRKWMPSALFQPVILLAVLSWSSASWALIVTVTIPPLAGIVAPLLGPQDQLNVLLKSGVSPHGFQLKPSHLGLIQNSDLLVSVGTSVDVWVEKPTRMLHTPHLSMANLPSVVRLPLRRGGLWESAHEHGAHETHETLHEADEHASHGDESTYRLVDQHVDRTMDGHLWMSVNNAIELVKSVSEQLKTLQPHQRDLIERRTQRWIAKLSDMDRSVMQQLQRVRQQPYLVLHDAFQYFEVHYQLNGVGSLRLNPELPPSLKRIHQLRNKVKSGQVRCVFKEPQFPAKRISAVIKGLNVKVGSLDPMGATYHSTHGYLTYDQFLQSLANQFISCLSVGGADAKPMLNRQQPVAN